MTDPRAVPANGRVAHVSLKDRVTAERYVEGSARQVWGEPFVCDAPDGARVRQLLHGDPFLVLETQGVWSFGRSEKDGYCGYVRDAFLVDPQAVTHRIAVRQSHLYPAAEVKAPAAESLSFNARLHVAEIAAPWAEVVTPAGRACVPSHHVRPLSETAPDLVTTAEQFLGVPYVWAGNSAQGIDCSGLVFAACQAAGIACPGDSDQQEHEVGRRLDDHEPLQRNDLVFWDGHVAIAIDGARIIHANAGAMAVSVESFEAACARIRRAGDGPVTARRRP